MQAGAASLWSDKGSGREVAAYSRADDAEAQTEEALAQAIVRDGIGRYFTDRRARIGPFVDKHFTLRGTLRLHRAAVGWDLARAPLNLALAAPQVGLFAAAAAARRLGAHRLAGALGGRTLTVETAVARELAWLIHTELLELPYEDEDRRSERDALAETILADPRITDALRPLLTGLAGSDPALRQRLRDTLSEYARTRTATAEVATTLLNLGAGSAAAGRVAAGAMSLAPALAEALGRSLSFASLPGGATLSALWLRLFPAATPSALLMTSLGGGLLAASTVASAFTGVVTDPVQRQLGLHQRRLERMIGALERQMHDPQAPGFAVRDHYVARLVGVFDLAGAVYRRVKPGA